MVFNLTGLYCLINRLFGQFDLLLAGKTVLSALQGSAAPAARPRPPPGLLRGLNASLMCGSARH